jgi:hypothetical protein
MLRRSLVPLELLLEIPAHRDPFLASQSSKVPTMGLTPARATRATQVLALIRTLQTTTVRAGAAMGPNTPALSGSLGRTSMGSTPTETVWAASERGCG